jgi:hypothetical protein
MKRRTAANVGVLVGLVMAGAFWLLVGEDKRVFKPELKTVGDEMAFGGFDPHRHVAVLELRTMDESLETGAAFASRLVFVTIRVRSSAARIRVDPGRLSYSIVSHEGGRFAPAFMTGENGVCRPWSGPPGPLEPGESVEFTLEFVIPQALDNPRLWIVERSRILRYLPWLEETPLFPKLVIPVSATGLAQPD